MVIKFMDANEILTYCTQQLEGVVLVNSWGERGIFYNPNHTLKRGVYILTVKEKDGENDKSSLLNRDGIYRINLGLRKQTFLHLFAPLPKRPSKGGVVNMDCDFSVTNQLLPHPVYAWMGWVCMLNPSPDSFETLKPLIQEAYEYAKEKYQKKLR